MQNYFMIPCLSLSHDTLEAHFVYKNQLTSVSEAQIGSYGTTQITSFLGRMLFVLVPDAILKGMTFSYMNAKLLRMYSIAQRLGIDNYFNVNVYSSYI